MYVCVYIRGEGVAIAKSRIVGAETIVAAYVCVCVYVCMNVCGDDTGG